MNGSRRQPIRSLRQAGAVRHARRTARKISQKRLGEPSDGGANQWRGHRILRSWPLLSPEQILVSPHHLLAGRRMNSRCGLHEWQLQFWDGIDHHIGRSHQGHRHRLPARDALPLAVARERPHLGTDLDPQWAPLVSATGGLLAHRGGPIARCRGQASPGRWRRRKWLAALTHLRTVGRLLRPHATPWHRSSPSRMRQQ